MTQDGEDGAAPVRVRVADGLAGVTREAWDRCAHSDDADADCEEDRHNPFVSHDFLRSLEDSGAVAARTGWLPRHLLVEADDGGLVAAMPCYLKSHSQGEYVFDHGWAEAYQRAGGRYYPKLQCSVPFTPVTGPRLLAAPGQGRQDARLALVAAAVELCRLHSASSVHWTFLESAEWDLLGQAGMLLRTDQQFHWRNDGYRSFDDFLAALSSRKRKAIRRERRDALAGGIEIVRLTGAQIGEEHWDAFFRFYMDTGSRKWGRPYLNRRFFGLVGERMADRVLLVMARRAGHWIAGALNFLGESTIYGRHWGAVEDHPFLHFEICYHQAIEHAVEHGYRRVEAGAQGAHKLARGYMPVLTRSAHFVADPGLRGAVADFLARERLLVEREACLLGEHAPFRRGP